MYSEQNTNEIIIERLLEQITKDIDMSEGSFTRDILSVVSNEMEQAYINLDTVLDVVFAQTSYNEYLDKRVEEFGIFRKQGTKATGTVTLTGDSGTLVLKGFGVETEDGLKFYTTEEVTIGTGGSVDVKVEAEDVGTAYNVPANTIILLSKNTDGVDNVNNTNPLSNGVNTESDEDLFDRFKLKVQTPATSGNANHYKLWALEVTDIGEAKVFPLWNGDGTVKVVVINSNRRAVTSTKVTEVANHIEEERPIGATVTVKSASEVTVNVDFTATLDSNYTQAEAEQNVINNLTEYLKNIAFKQDYVSYGLVGSEVINSNGIADYSNLLINNTSSNIAVGSEEVAVLGNVVITWQ